MSGPRRIAPHAARNTAPILEVLQGVLPAEGMVLEVASGSGQQSAAFADAFPMLVWQPSDPDPEAIASIDAWREESRLQNLLPPVELDARAADWPIASADALVCINMVHISPWAATEGLMRGAGRVLSAGAPLYLYGPYRRQGTETAPSNEAFDASLKARNPKWGLRWVHDVEAEATRYGLRLEAVTEMPANNLSLIFRE